MSVAHLHIQPIGYNKPVQIPEGLNIAQMAKHIGQGAELGAAFIEGKGPVLWEEIPRNMWGHIKPKQGIKVRFGVGHTVHGGGGGLGRILSIVAGIIAIIVAPALGGLIGGLGLGIGAASASTAIAGLGLSFIIQGIFQPSAGQSPNALQSPTNDENANSAYSNVTSDSNLLAKDAPFPYVAGLRRMAPMETCYPHRFVENGIVKINRHFAWWGSHAISDVKVSNTPTENSDEFTTEIKDADGNQSQVTFVENITYPQAISQELTRFTVREGGVLVSDYVVPDNSEPRLLEFASVDSADSPIEQIEIFLLCRSFVKTDAPTVTTTVPVRMEFRKRGETTWNKLPEMHFQGADQGTVPKQITIRWDAVFPATSGDSNIAVGFFTRVPAITSGTPSDGATGDQWLCHENFRVNATDLSVPSSSISENLNGVNITFDEADFPKGAYEFRVRRGAGFQSNQLSNVTYIFAGEVYTWFFSYTLDGGTTYRTVVDQSEFAGQLQFGEITTVFANPPITEPGFTQLAVQSLGRTMRNVTCLAGAKIKTWNGSIWTGAATTKNPAAHLYHLYESILDERGVNTAIISSDLETFYDHCNTYSLEVNYVASAGSFEQVRNAICAAGFAVPFYDLDQWSVAYFRDRSSDTPVQIFSDQNADISFSKLSQEIPLITRVSYANEDNEYFEAEYRYTASQWSNYTGSLKISYNSITKPELVQARVDHDHMVMTERDIIAYVETDFESNLCTVDDLVLIVSDIFADDVISGWVDPIGSASVTKLSLYDDANVADTTSLYDVTNVYDEINLYATGQEYVAFIQTASGTENRDVTSIVDGVITLASALTSVPENGAHITIVPSSQARQRFIVRDVTRNTEEKGVLVCVPAADKIWDEITDRHSWL